MKSIPPPPKKRGFHLPVNQVVCGDNIEVISKWPTDCIDLTVTSPPYDNLRDYKGYDFNFENLAQQLYRVTKSGGVIVWVVRDMVKNKSETGTSFKQALYFMDVGFNLHDTMIYENQCVRFPCRTRYHSSFEYMFIFCKGGLKTFNPLIDRPNKTAGSKIARKSQNREKNGKLYPNSAWKKDKNRQITKYGKRFNIWRYKVGKNLSTKDEIAFQHPAIFPDALANDHILSWSNPNDIILDPMCGSGTTCKMAKLNNRKYIGIDISEEYCNIARERIKSVNWGEKSGDKNSTTA